MTWASAIRAVAFLADKELRYLTDSINIQHRFAIIFH